jgi:hypothetical protein
LGSKTLGLISQQRTQGAVLKQTAAKEIFASHSILLPSSR